MTRKRISNTTLTLRIRCGQVVLEYLILFAVVATLTILGVTTFDDTIKSTMQDFFHAAADAITK